MSRRRNSDSATSALAIVLLAIFALPLVGLYLMSKQNGSHKMLGLVLTVVGFAIWVWIALAG